MAAAQRLRRAESFLGVHFDFHARADDPQIGTRTTREMLEDVIQQVQPDYIQCDCKGHAGWSSYPTLVGHAAPGVMADALRLWREVTAEHGVALYLHYSGVWDAEAVRRHPDWAVVTAEGQPDERITATFGPYVDRLLIPQLEELNDEYEVDGVWVDGDCWATLPDYNPGMLTAFQQASGMQSVPVQPGDPGWYEFNQFYREAFRRYLRHYVDELHRHNPAFQVASNWAYSSFMPEPVSVAVDYISGDYTLQNSVNSARLEGRCMLHQGKPWDLMAWGFATKLFQADSSQNEGAVCTKSAVQLQQEAAVVLSLGGGFQAYFTQKRDGSLRAYQMKVMGEVARFCRARQPYCHQAEALPQVAVLYAGSDYYRRNPALFHPGDLLLPMRGVLQALLDNQYSTEVLMEHHLLGRSGDYPLIVVPGWETISAELHAELLQYVRAGGSLLLVGAPSARLFLGELDVEFTGETESNAERYLEYEGMLTGLSKTAVQAVRLGPSARPFGRLYLENDLGGLYQVAATLTPYGQGQIAALYFSFGERYLRGQTALARDFLAGLCRQLFPQPRVQVLGSHHVDVSLMRKEGHLAIHLVNTAGPHADRDVYTYDELPSLGPLEVRLRTERAPQSIQLQPGGRAVAWDWADGIARMALPRLEIYDILWVKE